MMKRLVIAAVASAAVVLPISAGAASAAPAEHGAKQPVVKIIDWE